MVTIRRRIAALTIAAGAVTGGMLVSAAPANAYGTCGFDDAYYHVFYNSNYGGSYTCFNSFEDTNYANDTFQTAGNGSGSGMYWNGGSDSNLSGDAVRTYSNTSCSGTEDTDTGTDQSHNYYGNSYNRNGSECAY